MDPNTQPNKNVRITYNDADFHREKPTVGIEFFNINSGETRLADSEALITAFYNSSNLHVNAMGGQDFGWRLAKQTLRRIRDIRDNEDVLDRIVAKFRLTEVSEVTDSHILTHLFNEDLRQTLRAESDKQNQFAKQYEADVRSLDEEDLGLDDDDEEEDDDEGDDEGSDTTQLKPAPKPAAKKKAGPRLSNAQKSEEKRRIANAKRREENLEEGRDINDGIILSPQEQAALGNIPKSEGKTVANEDTKSDNKSNS